MDVAYSHPVATAIALIILYVAAKVLLGGPRKAFKPVPGPSGWPLIGNALELANSDGNLIPFFNKWAKKYGPLVQFSLLGQNQVVISSDAIANELFVKRGSKYSSRGTPYAVKYVTKDMGPALIDRSDLWRRQRRLIHESMLISTNDTYQGLMSHEATLALCDLLDDPSKFREAFLRYSYGTLTRCLLGFEIQSGHDQYVVETDDFIDEMMNCFRPDMYPVNIFSILRYFPSWSLRSLRDQERLKSMNLEHALAPRKRLEQSLKDDTALESIYRHFYEGKKPDDISMEEIDFAFQAMIGGGTRSPFNALHTFIYLMMEYPEWLSKLQDQIDQVVGSDRLPKPEDIPSLPVARAIVKESIRYRSIVAELGIPHKLEEDDVYGEYFFPKGTVFHANYSLILMDKTTYPDQKLFNPARWLNPSYPTYKEPLTVHPNCQNFTPFGYGRRACPGYNFAERALVIMIMKMAWAFQIRKPIDPATNKPVVLDIKYEPVPNPKAYPFPCDLVPRDEKRMKMVQEEIKELAKTN